MTAALGTSSCKSCSLPSGDPALYLQHVDAHSLGGGGLDIRGPGGWRLTGASSFIYSRLVRGKVIKFLAAIGVDVSSRTQSDSESECLMMYAAYCASISRTYVSCCCATSATGTEPNNARTMELCRRA